MPTQPFAPPGATGTWLEPMPSAAVETTTAGASDNYPVQAFGAEPLFSPTPQTFAAPAAREAPKPDIGDFESARGWAGASSELTVVPGGVTGKAVRVHRTSNSETFAVVAAKAVAGSKPRYRARAYVRSLSPGMFVCIRIEELTRARFPRMTERCRPATTGWQRLGVETRSTAKGSRLVVSVRVLAALGGTSFDVDGFRLR